MQSSCSKTSRAALKMHVQLRAAIKGAGEVGFTVLSMSVSLVAVFIPILLMGGIIGRLFREFAVTLSIRHPPLARSIARNHADDVRICAQAAAARRARPALSLSERIFSSTLHVYERSLAWSLRHHARSC